VEAQLPVERQGDSVARDIILGRPEPTGDDNDLGPADGAANSVGKPLAVVSDHALGHYLNAEAVELVREVEGIRIQALRGEKLGADCDNLRLHRLEQGTPSDADIHAIDSVRCRNRQRARWSKRQADDARPGEKQLGSPVLPDTDHSPASPKR